MRAPRRPKELLLYALSVLALSIPGTAGSAPGGSAPTKPATTQPAAEGKWEVVYSNDFQDKVGHQWSRDNTETTPKESRRFLGPFGNDKVSLLLADVPDHKYIRVTFGVFLLRSWDGNHFRSGPDLWELSVEKGPTLIRSTFSNHAAQGNRQSFPDSYPWGDHPHLTGAAEKNTLGYTYYFGSIEAERECDSVYRLSVLAPHTAGSLRLNFAAFGLEELDNESWGIKSVTVEVTSSNLAANYDDRRLTKLWIDLGGEAMTGFASTWELVAAGDKAAAFIKDHVADASLPEDARVKQLIAELDDAKLSVRESASKELAKLGPGVAAALRKVMETTKSEEVRGRIQEILGAMGRQRGGDPSIIRWMRAIRVLEIIGSDKAKEVLKVLAEKAPAMRVREAAAESLSYLRTGERKPLAKPTGDAPADQPVDQPADQNGQQQPQQVEDISLLCLPF